MLVEPQTNTNDRLSANLDGGKDFWKSLVSRISDLPLPLVRAIAELLTGLGRERYKKIGRDAGERLRQERAECFLSDIFPSAPLPRPGPERQEPRPVEPVDPEMVGEMLGPGGAFAVQLTGYEHRSGQIEMARAVTGCLNSSKHLMVEGGTGIGKSLAYLVPSVLWSLVNGRPVVVSTNTKNLQHQLFGKDLPLIRRVMDSDFRAALIKGRMNYLCLRKTLFAVEHPLSELTPEERPKMVRLLCWVAGSETGDLSECPVWDKKTSRALGLTVTATGEECMGRACRMSRKCFLLRARAKAQTADLVIANHALIFAEMGMTSPALPPFSHVVFDEAHNLEEAATKHFSVELSMPRVKFELSRIWRPKGKHDGLGLIPGVTRQVESGAFAGDERIKTDTISEAWAVVDSVKRVDRSASAFFDALAVIVGKKESTLRIYAGDHESSRWSSAMSAKEDLQKSVREIIADIEKLMKSLRALECDGLPFHLEAVHDLEGAVCQLHELCTDMDFVLDAAAEDFVFWIEKADRRQDKARAWGAPVSVGDRLENDLYSQKECVVFSSATLSVNGSYDFLKKRIGLDAIPPGRLVELDAGSPFDYTRQCMVAVPAFLPEPSEAGADYAGELGALMAAIFERTRGRGMVLFTSYKMLRETTDVVRDKLEGRGIQVLAQGESGSREAITAAFKEDIESVLMGTHSFWEGVDAVGETLSCLVVARLPFAVFTDPIIAARCEQIDNRGGSSFIEYSVPSAVIRFRQGFGRLIRHRTDRGVVIVADRRIVTKRYGSWFRNSLPSKTVRFEDADTMIQAVESFLGEV
jgi:DNA polymerase-3 subunit epsilon/ATP-dependent DNA helicase DinG